MHQEDEAPAAGTGLPCKNRKPVIIRIVALSLCGTGISRGGLHNYHVEVECYAPGKTHTISVNLLASSVGVDSELLRQCVKGHRLFVNMRWGIGLGAKARFQTSLLLTQDTQPYIKFTSGLEKELELEKYAQSLESPSVHVRELVASGQNINQGGGSVNTRESSLSRQTILDCAQPLAATKGTPAISEISDNETAPGGSPSQPALDISTPSECEEIITDEEWANIQVKREEHDNRLYEERKAAELLHLTTGDMGGLQSLIPPSMEDAQTSGPQGTPWVWSRELQTWHWMDRYGRTWWYPNGDEKSSCI